MPERILSGTIDDKGYIHFRLTKSNQRPKLYKMHNLVARLFIRDYDSSIDTVHHIDGDKRNNSVDNLIILDRQEHSRLHSKLGKNAFKDKWFTPERKRKKKIRCIEDNNIFSTQIQACRAYNLHKGNLSYHLQGKTKSIKGLHFEFIED